MIEQLIEIARGAGLAIEEIAKKSFNIKIKEDKTPVTEADLASHHYIADALKESFPDIPLLSEENCDIPYSERSKWHTYFLVDPLDGTKEFIKQNGMYAVLISLVVNNRPTVGVIHAPVSNETWYGKTGEGSFKIEPDGSKTKLKVSKAPQDVRVAVSASHLTKITSEYMRDNLRGFETHPIGSAIKFCRIAEGKVDVYPRLGPTSEWDTAAGEVILTEAGGKVLQYKNKELIEYNKESLRNPWFIAFGEDLEKLN
ncbi:MAG: 3'(2'),5'-bisphosphate nucleotidase [Halobacteriovorax sp.]|nr:3'(2'),5'-bisphosphate nucleotidase [Halobacteriovorax sp.]|tara:strand:+ start:19512 stop:20279 length:768 start_codon:yes stop_codon:yes gene_type:complete